MGLIFFYVYPSAFQNPGGGEMLLLKTREHLQKLNCQISLFNMWEDHLTKNDILHVFGSVKEAYGLMQTAKSIGTKIVHSPIIWYTWRNAFGIFYRPKERMLCILRQCGKTFLPIIPSMRKKMMEAADIVLASTRMEADQIKRYFLIPEKKIRVVTYGTDEYFAHANKEVFIKKYALQNFILTVGRIEPRKNHLNLIRAMKGIDRKLVIIGEPVSHYQDYYQKCREEADSNVIFLGALPQNSNELRSAYAACDVFVLPSWCESPGLSALEAGLAGAKIVLTSGGTTKEYFKDMVEYLEPSSVTDIKNKIFYALEQKKSDLLKEYIQKRFLWQYTAQQTMEVYQSLTN